MQLARLVMRQPVSQMPALLADLAALQRRQAGGPLDFPGRIERDLALWQEIECGGDVTAICALLGAVRSTASGSPMASDWTPREIDIEKFLLWQLGRSDPQGTLKALGKGDLETLGPVFTAWAEKDPQAALKAADENYHDLNRACAVVVVLSRMAQGDFAEAIRLAGSLRKEDEDPVSALLGSMASNEPQRALDFLLVPGNSLDESQRSSLLRDTLLSFHKSSDQPFWPLLDQLAQRPELTDAAANSLGVYAALPASLPTEAVTLFEKLPPAAQEKALVSGLAVALYRSDAAHADQILSGLPEEAAAHAVEAAAGSALEGGRIEFPPDPVLAHDIASRLPFERQLELMDSWNGYAALNGGHAGKWLAQMTDPGWRDQFAEKFAGMIAPADPLNAARIAASIADETRRQAVLTPILQKWQAEFPGAAKAWQAEWDKQVPTTGSLPAVAQ